MCSMQLGYCEGRELGSASPAQMDVLRIAFVEIGESLAKSREESHACGIPPILDGGAPRVPAHQSIVSSCAPPSLEHAARHLCMQTQLKRTQGGRLFWIGVVSSS